MLLSCSGYMKILDRPSVVREGEQATTRNAAGVPEAIRGMYNQLIGGGQLSAEARTQILSAAESVYEESAANIEDLNKRYTGIAGAWGIDPSGYSLFLSSTKESRRAGGGAPASTK